MKILSMSGFVPEQICDTVRFSQYAGERNISHYCGYASDFISQVLLDDSIDGAVYPRSCDSSRIISSYLKAGNKFLFQINVPAFGGTDAKEYFASSIREYEGAVKKYYDVELDDIYERTERINERNRVLSQLYGNLAELSFSDYLQKIHQMLELPLKEQKDIKDIKGHITTDKKVFVVGSFLSNIEIAKLMEATGFTVVGDTLTESGRLVSTPAVRLDGDIYKGIASSILAQRLSPSQNCFREILMKDMEEIKRKSAKGVIFVTQKYCEAYDYLYATYKSAFDAVGIPVLRISVNDTEDSRKVALSLEAFADTLK